MSTRHPSETDLDAASRALFALGRALARTSRRDLFVASPDSNHGHATDLGAILLTQSIADAQTAGQDVTVGTVAVHLAIDPSTASRLVARATANGYVRRRPTPEDGRAIALHLTESGQSLATDAARYQRSIFDAATQGWSPSDRDTFARLFVDFAATIATLTSTRSVLDSLENA